MCINAAPYPCADVLRGSRQVQFSLRERQGHFFRQAVGPAGLFQHIIIVRTVRIMTIRTGQSARRLVGLPRGDLGLVVAIKTEIGGVGNEEKRLSRSMRMVADAAPARGSGSMDLSFPEIQGMAIQTKLFYGQDEVAPSLPMARLAQSGSVGTVVSDRGSIGSVPIHFFRTPPWFSFFPTKRGHAVEKKIQCLVPRFRRTPRNRDHCRDTHHEQCQREPHGFSLAAPLLSSVDFLF